MKAESAAKQLKSAWQPVPWNLLLWIGAAPLLLFPSLEPAAAAAASLTLVVGWVLARRRVRFRPATFLDRPLLIYLSLSALAFLASPLPAYSLRRLTTLLLGTITFYGGATWLANPHFLLSRYSRIVTAIMVFGLAGGLIAVIGLLTVEWPTRYLFDLRALTNWLPHARDSVTIYHNQLAGILVFLLPLGFFGYRRVSGRTERWLPLLAVCLMALTLLLTQSRNGVLGAFVALAGTLIWGRGRFRYLLPFLLCLFLLPFALGRLPAPASKGMAEYLDNVDMVSKGESSNIHSWLARLETWSIAARMMDEYPVLGAGLYTFDPVSRANYVYQIVSPTFPLTHAHNLFLQAGTGLGWAGWLASVVLWLSVLHGLWQATRASPVTERGAGRALGGAFLGYLSFNTFDVLALEQRVGLLVWLILALTAAYVAQHKPVLRRSLRALHLTPLGLFLVLSLTPAFSRNLAHLQLDRARLGGAPYLAPAVADLGPTDYRRHGLLHYLHGRHDAALAAWKKDPDAVRFLESQGLYALFQAQDMITAIDWFRQALALDPEVGRLYYWQGRAYEQLGETDEALQQYRWSVAHGEDEIVLGVSVQAAAWEKQGRLLVQDGQWQAAHDAFAHAVVLEPGVAAYRQQLEEVKKALAESEAAQEQ